VPRWCFEMLKQVSPGEAHVWIEELLMQRPDMGLRKALTNVAFQRQNPFDAGARRNLRLGLMIAAILLVAALGVLIYFNAA
jgi:hypothetical protein